MADELNEILTAEFLNKLGNHSVQIVDVRPVDAYNGWALQWEPRGGHIKGARSLPWKWIHYQDWIEMVRRKKILPEQEIILYGYSRYKINEVAGYFLKSGYHKVSVYYHFVDEWTTNDLLPMDYLERYPHLVPARWVNTLISGEKPDHYENNKYVIVQAHHQNRKAYLSGHIPGAIDMDTLTLEVPETLNRRSPEELKRTFEHHGITADTTVVLYGKYMDPPDYGNPFPGSAAGDIGAMRCAFIMMYAGVKDIRILNGGFQSWKDEGFEISYNDEPKKPVREFGLEIPAHSELAVDTPLAKQMLASASAELVYVQSFPEDLGEENMYDYVEISKGRIPGAIFADYGSDAYRMENYRNFDLTTREYHEIAEFWSKKGIAPYKHLAFYCSTGWRGSEAWFNAWLMGWPRVSVYDGGWNAWCTHPKNPFENDIPENHNVSIPKI